MQQVSMEVSSNTVLCKFGVKYSLKHLIFVFNFLCDVWDNL